MDLNVIKSYLVSLGFKVNNAEFNKTTSSLAELNRQVTSVTSSMKKEFIAASTTIVGSIVGITTASAKLIDHVGQLDMGYQKFALRMYTTTQQAKQLKIVTEAMGENINDIAWIPELRERYFSLIKQTGVLESQMGGDMGGVMRSIRDTRFEITRLKVEATYAMQWIVYYIIKHLGGAFGNFKGSLQDINNWIVKNMPIWTEKIGKFIADTLVKIWSLIERLNKLWNGFDEGNTKILLLATSILYFFNAGPIGKFLALAAAVELVGKDIGISNTAWEDLNGIIDKIIDIFGEFVKDLFESFSEQGVWPALKQSLTDCSDGAGEFTDGLVTMMKQLGLLNSDYEYKSGVKSLADLFAYLAKTIANTTGELGNLLKLTGFIIKRDFSSALNLFEKIQEKNLAKRRNSWQLGPFTFGNDESESPSFGGDIDTWITEAAQRYGIPENIFRKLVQAESGGNPNALSSANAMGLTQLMPDTAAEMGVNPWDPHENLLGGAKYLRQQYDRFGNWRDALAAYNAGPGAVESGKAWGYSETQNYVQKILGMSSSNVFSNLKASALNFNALSNNNNYGFGGMDTGATAAYDNGTNIGVINININGTNQNPQQIGNEVIKQFKSLQTKNNARQVWNNAGIGVTV